MISASLDASRGISGVCIAEDDGLFVELIVAEEKYNQQNKAIDTVATRAICHDTGI